MIRIIITASLALAIGCGGLDYDDTDDGCTHRIIVVDLEDPACYVTWPQTDEEYMYASLHEDAYVDGLVGLWATRGEYTEWEPVSYVEVEVCAEIPGSPVASAPPDVVILDGRVLVRFVLVGVVPAELLALECSP